MGLMRVIALGVYALLSTMEQVVPEDNRYQSINHTSVFCFEK